jgi:hypothetical protein
VPKVIITHAVVEIDRWLAGSADRAAAIESASGSNVTDYVAHDGSANVAIAVDVADLEQMSAMLAAPTPDVLAKMEQHGVVPPIMAYVQA